MFNCSSSDFAACYANCGECPKGGQSVEELRRDFQQRYPDEQKTKDI